MDTLLLSLGNKDFKGDPASLDEYWTRSLLYVVLFNLRSRLRKNVMRMKKETRWWSLERYSIQWRRSLRTVKCHWGKWTKRSKNQSMRWIWWVKSCYRSTKMTFHGVNILTCLQSCILDAYWAATDCSRLSTLKWTPHASVKGWASTL